MFYSQRVGSDRIERILAQLAFCDGFAAAAAIVSLLRSLEDDAENRLALHGVSAKELTDRAQTCLMAHAHAYLDLCEHSIHKPTEHFQTILEFAVELDVPRSEVDKLMKRMAQAGLPQE